jgi:formate hydrogenlyase transcriptional activator
VVLYSETMAMGDPPPSGVPGCPLAETCPAIGPLPEFEILIAGLSSRFINLPPDEVDREIEDALRRVCEPLGIDYAVLWQWSAATRDVLTPTHAFPALEAPGLAEPLRQEHFPWVVRQITAGRTVAIRSMDEMPAEFDVDRENARRLGIQSNLTLPLSVGGEAPVGALAFNTLRAPRDWPDTLVLRLQLVAQVFANALARKRHELSLRQSEERARLASDSAEVSQVRLAAGAELAGLAFYEVDFGAGAAYFDARLLELCGVPREREQGLGPVEFWLEHLHPDDRERVSEQRRELHEGMLDLLSIEYRYLHPTRGETWLSHIARVATRDAAGQRLKTFGVLRDVTERRQREEALRRSYEEIARLKDRLQAESDYLKAEIRVVDPQNQFTGESAAIRNVMQLVEQVAATDASVLVCGETGSGKELVAQAVHRLSSRRGQLMVKINCAALPSGLVESELFGREKGAFTGAMTRQVGRFEVADGSTLFLDEIGELSLEVQSKLLRVLETGEFERLGSPSTIKIDVRLVAATNRDLLEEVRKGRFREDLFYRLNVFPIRVPPLRERAEDIPPLVWAFLEEFGSRMGKRIKQVPRKTMEALQRHPWPGNVRELRNVIERGVIRAKGDTLRVSALDDGVASAAMPRQTLAEGERELILRALEGAGWHIKGPKGAAAALGLNPSTLYGRMKKLGIRPRGEPNGPR